MALKRFFREALREQIIATEINLLLPAGLAVNEAPLGPTLSQFGLNASDFCDFFNEITSDSDSFKKKILVRVRIYRQIDSFSVQIIGPSFLSFLYLLSFSSQGFKKNIKDDYYFNRGYILFFSDLVALAKIQYHLQGSKKKKSVKSFTKSLLSTTASCSMGIIFDK